MWKEPYKTKKKKQYSMIEPANDQGNEMKIGNQNKLQNLPAI